MPELDAQHRAQLADILRANGLTDQPADYDSDIHSWRCRYPDRYGPCKCLDELVDDLAPLVAEWLADAWDTGHEAGSEDADEEYRGAPPSDRQRNPYRGGDS